MNHQKNSPARRVIASSAPVSLPLAVTVLLVLASAVPCQAARSGFRPKVIISVHDTKTPPIGNK